MFTLIMWIAGCVFEGCPIETYEVQYYDSMERCVEARDIGRGISPDHVVECMPGKIPEWKDLPFWDRR